MIKIFLADDQRMLLSALAALLDLEDDLEVVGTAGNGLSALTEIKRLKPDVAILDIEMPEMTGLDVAEKLRTDALPIKLIILTTFAQEAYFQKAVKFDVNGYLLKDSRSEILIRTIHDVLAGDTVFSPELVKSVLKAEKNPLTAREMEVLIAMQTGRSTLEIAHTVYLSEGTVRNYISSILSKTGSRNRIEAINLAQTNGWLT
ncbi:MAG: response regulator transcription factor [Streptococcaceae bacterium]|jgi:two-component system response regulator DesR|nr:response regulator transcription factor [Streptococcaceae bacterium]